ncbi:hypothetical protein SNEBB_006901 [Seison nebaliae]|nr:hypothetical protein SNEBB_006901 [Seison nebaliae]
MWHSLINVFVYLTLREKDGMMLHLDVRCERDISLSPHMEEMMCYDNLINLKVSQAQKRLADVTMEDEKNGHSIFIHLTLTRHLSSLVGDSSNNTRIDLSNYIIQSQFIISFDLSRSSTVLILRLTRHKSSVWIDQKWVADTLKNFISANHVQLIEEHQLTLSNLVIGSCSWWEVKKFFAFSSDDDLPTLYVYTGILVDHDMYNYMEVMLKQKNKQLFDYEYSVDTDMVKRAISNYLNLMMDIVHYTVWKTFNIHVYLSKIIILDHRISPYENERYVKHRINYWYIREALVSPNILDIFRLWMGSVTEVHSNDFQDINVWMLYTTKAIFNRYNMVRGSTYHNTLCSSKLKYQSVMAIQHNNDVMLNAVVVMHQFGHLIGAPHNSEAGARWCGKNKKGQYMLMDTPFTSPTKLLMLFSGCTYLIVKHNPFLECLKNKSEKIHGRLNQFHSTSASKNGITKVIDQFSLGNLYTPDIHCQLSHGLTYVWDRNDEGICNRIRCIKIRYAPYLPEHLMTKVWQLFGQVYASKSSFYSFPPENTKCRTSDGYIGQCRTNYCIKRKPLSKKCLYEIDYPVSPQCGICGNKLKKRLSCYELIKYNYLTTNDLVIACKLSYGCCNLCEELLKSNFENLCETHSDVLCGRNNTCLPTTDNRWFTCKCNNQPEDLSNLPKGKMFIERYCILHLEETNLELIKNISRLEWKSYFDMILEDSDRNRLSDDLFRHEIIDWTGLVEQKRNETYTGGMKRVDPNYTAFCQKDMKCHGIYGYKEDNMESYEFPNSTGFMPIAPVRGYTYYHGGAAFTYKQGDYYRPTPISYMTSTESMKKTSNMGGHITGRSTTISMRTSQKPERTTRTSMGRETTNRKSDVKFVTSGTSLIDTTSRSMTLLTSTWIRNETINVRDVEVVDSWELEEKRNEEQEKWRKGYIVSNEQYLFTNLLPFVTAYYHKFPKEMSLHSLIRDNYYFRSTNTAQMEEKVRLQYKDEWLRRSILVKNHLRWKYLFFVLLSFFILLIIASITVFSTTKYDSIAERNTVTKKKTSNFTEKSYF